MRKWEPGISWSIHRGHTAVVPGQSLPMCEHVQYVQVLVIRALKDFFREVTQSLLSFEHEHRATQSAKYPHV